MAPETPQISELNTKDWIAFPDEFLNGKYLGIVVNHARLSMNSAVEKAGKYLGLRLRNTSKDSLGREFAGNINWEQALKLNLLTGNYTLPISQGVDFLNLLYSGSQGKIKVYNEAGKKLDKQYLEKIFLDIVGLQSPWRAEWLDANFTFNKNSLYINSNHILDVKGNLYPSQSEILNENTLMKDKTPGIDLIDFITKNHTSSGLPNKNVKFGNFYYFYPRSNNNSVAMFNANSDRADLDCDRLPLSSNDELGVRSAKKNK